MPWIHPDDIVGSMKICCGLILLGMVTASAQPPRNGPDPALVASRNAKEKELESIAIIDRKVMVPMRDGKRMAADIYRPKDASSKVPDHLRAHAVQLQLLGRAERRRRAT